MERLTTDDLEHIIAESLPIWVERRPDLGQRLRQALDHVAESSAGRMSFDEFLEWADENTWAEWVDGEVLGMSPASIKHQDIDFFLAKIIAAFVEHGGLGKVFIPPFLMKLEESGREPDVTFVATKNLGRLKANYLDGPADLVVEIVSPGSIGTDRGEKFEEYEAAGIPEYWLIDPVREQAEFYLLGEDARYHLAALNAEGLYHSKMLPGLWLRVEWLWQEPLPSTLDVLRELKVIS